MAIANFALVTIVRCHIETNSFSYIAYCNIITKLPDAVQCITKISAPGPAPALSKVWSARPRAGAQVSAPISWEEVDDVEPEDLTIATVGPRVAQTGDPWAAMDGEPASLEPLLEWHARDMAAGLMDAPWPPVYPKMPNEPPRVAPSRAAGAKQGIEPR